MKHLLIILSFSIFLFSCQKELGFDDIATNKYYIKCKIDGTARTFNYEGAASITKSTRSDSSFFIIHGYASEDVNNLESMALYMVFPSGALEVGKTYKEGGDWVDYLTLGEYTPNNDSLFYSAGYVSDVTADSLNIRITSKTTTEVSGTFKGAFYKTDVNDNEIHPEYLHITEGEFKLLLQ